MLPRCSCISRCGRRPCKPYRLSVFFGLYFRLSCMMPLIVGYKCSRPVLPTVSAQSYTFFITIKKVCAHDNKGFTSRQKGLRSRWKNLLSGFAGLRSRFLAYEIALQNVKISRSLTHHIRSATPALSLASSEASYEWNFSLCDVYNALYLRK